MVVVVVHAMVQKGERVGRMDIRIGRAPSKDHNVSQRISLSEIERVEKGEEYIFECKPRSKTDFEPFSIVAQVHSSQHSFCIPVDKIKSRGLKPGHAATITVFEILDNTLEPESQDTPSEEGGWVQVATTNVISDSSSADNCDSRVTNWKLHNKLTGREEVMVSNTSKGKTATGIMKPISNNAVSFPKKLRRKLDAAPNDTLEIYLHRPHETAAKAESDTIEEIYDMVSDLHSAYLEAKDD